MDFTTESSYGQDRFSYRITLQAAPSVEGHIYIETPFPGLEIVEFGFLNQESFTAAKRQVSVSFTPSVVYKFTIETTNGQEKSLSINVQTPYEPINDFTVFGSYQMSDHVMSYHFTLSDGEVNVINNDVSLTLSPYYELTAALTTPYHGLEQTSFGMKLENVDTSTRMQFDLSYNNGQRVSSSMQYDPRPTGLRAVFELNTPCVYLTDFAVAAEYTTTGSTINPSFSLRHNQHDIITLSGEVTAPTRINLSLTTPVSGYEVINVEMSNEESNNRYEPSMVLSWNQERVEVRGALVKSGSRYNTRVEGSIEINTPWALLSDARLQADHTSGRGALTTRLSGRYNRQEMVDMELQTNQEGARRTANFVLRSPAQFTGSASLEGNFETFVANVDATVDGQTVGVEVQRSSQPGNHAILVKLTTPARIMEVSSTLESSETRMAHTTVFTWDKTRGRTVTHSIVVESHSSRYNKDYSLTTRLDMPIRSFELTVGHQKTSSAMASSLVAMWDAANDRTKKISLSNRLEETQENYVHELTLGYPGAERDITLRNELGINTAGKIFSGRSQLEYSTDSRRHLTISASLQDITTDGQNYTMQVSLGVRHPISQLDMELVSSIADSPVAMAADVQMNYLTVARQMNNMRLRGEIQKLRKRINMEMQSAAKSFRLDGKLQDSDDHVTVRLVATSDNTRQVSASLDLNSVENTLDMRAYMDPENQNSLVHMIGKYGPNSVAFDAYHQDGESHVSDAELDVEVRDRRLVYSKLFWRPALINELKSAISTKMAEIKSSMESGYSLTSDFVQQEVTARQAQLPAMPAAAAFIATEGQSLQADWQVVVREWHLMYENNEFYMQNIEAAATTLYNTISTFTTSVIQHISEHMQATYEAVSHAYTANKAMILDTLQELKQVCITICDAVLEQYRQVAAYSQARWQVAKQAAMERAVEVTRNVVMVVGPYANAVANYTAHYAQEAYGYVSSHPYVTSARQSLSQIDLMAPLTDAHMSMRRNIYNMSSALAGYIDQAVQRYSTMVQEGREVSMSLLNEVLAYPQVRYALTFVQNTTEQIAELYNNMEFESESRQALEAFLTSAAESVRQNAIYFVDTYLQLDQNRIINWTPAEGLLEFQFYVPADLPEFQDMQLNIPDFTMIYKLWRSRILRLIPDMTDFSPWDYYYQYVPSMDTATWLPPFDSYALIAGRQHLMTFDGTFYDFSSPCMHVLAGDHVTGTWSLTTGPVIDDDVARSLVFAAGADKIVLTPTYEVIINGEQRELPVELSSAVVLREGNTLSVSTNNGVSLSCEMTHDVCRLDLSGWHFGKTGGLLGTYNNEHIDDMSAPNGQRMNTFTDFAASWAVTEGCRGTNLVPALPATPTPACRAFFNDSNSPFRPCYKIVDPAPFMQVCANESRNQHDEVCKAASMYVQACAKQQVNIPTPAKCGRCDAEHQLGDVTTSLGLSSADVVFVVEEASCNQDMLTHLRQMAIKMETMAFRDLGMRNSQFGLVGYGGSGSHAVPHSHTFSGQLFGTARTFRRTLTTFQFSDQDDVTDVFAALRLAASYPFRAGASKSVIVASCSAGRYSDSEAEALMQELGIAVHVLRSHDFEVATSTEAPRTSRLFGVDSNTAFTSDHISDEQLVGDVSLHQQITAPSDGLTQLAHSSGGALFDVGQLTSGRVAVQKRFVDVFVRRVAQSAVPASCQICSCEPSGLTAAVSICRPCPGAWPAAQFPAVVNHQDN